MAIGSQGTVDLFDFDRCNGLLLNHMVVDHQSSLNPYGCEFSTNGTYLYISSGADLQPGKPFNFYLGDSSRATVGLPNIPNYELGPLTIYQANAGEDKSWCSNDSIKGAYIGSEEVSGVQYSWYPTEGLDNPSIAKPFANPSQTTMYVLTVTDTSIKYSCQSRDDTVWVRVVDCDTSKRQLFFPDAFTPNNDGVNDFFGPLKSVTELIELKIYNRWGQIIHDSPVKWDGNYKSKPQSIGTFVYYAIVQKADGERKRVSGIFSLIR